MENELLEQESHLRLQEVSSMKKAQLVASRTIEKLKNEVGKEEQDWKDHTNKVIEELRQENIHLLKLYEAGQVCRHLKTTTAGCGGYQHLTVPLVTLRSRNAVASGKLGVST